LKHVDAILAVVRALERPEEEIGSHRMNRANILTSLGRFEEAKDEMEACLVIFRNDPTRRARTLSPLAELFSKQGDLPQAIALERCALAIREQLSDPNDRSISHGNLATYLEWRGRPADRAESTLHQLAGLVYLFAAGLGKNLQTSWDNYAAQFRRAHAARAELNMPSLVELLTDPAFWALEEWLRGRGVEVVDLQETVDQFLKSARQAALAAE